MSAGELSKARRGPTESSSREPDSGCTNLYFVKFLLLLMPFPPLHEVGFQNRYITKRELRQRNGDWLWDWLFNESWLRGSWANLLTVQEYPRLGLCRKEFTSSCNLVLNLSSHRKYSCNPCFRHTVTPNKTLRAMLCRLLPPSLQRET